MSVEGFLFLEFPYFVDVALVLVPELVKGLAVSSVGNGVEVLFEFLECIFGPCFVKLYDPHIDGL